MGFRPCWRLPATVLRGARRHCHAGAPPGGSSMPFLHGFRRIIFEYQPLVDEILGLLALQDAARRSELER